MSEAAAWLRDRISVAPPRLLDAMLRALPDDAALGIPDTLAAAAVSLYRDAAARAGGRQGALDLLAADALLTHAIQAQAELDPPGIGRFASIWSGRHSLGDLVR